MIEVLKPFELVYIGAGRAKFRTAKVNQVFPAGIADHPKKVGHPKFFLNVPPVGFHCILADA